MTFLILFGATTSAIGFAVWGWRYLVDFLHAWDASIAWDGVSWTEDEA